MKKILLMVVCVFSYTAQAQFGPKQMVSEIGGAEVYTFDLDGDDDLDILIASGHHVSWFENLDGLGDFGTEQLIANLEGRISTYAGDIDGDGDIDVIATESIWSKPLDLSKLVWYENLDGQGSFSTEQLIEDYASFIIARSVYVTDLDGDEDNDILTGSHGDLFWYQNLDGLGSFGEMQIITTDVAIVKAVYADDIDGDGDMDVLASSIQDEKLTWYENTDGISNFGQQQIIAENIGEAWSIYISDLNGDGHKDVLAAYWETGNIVWFENTDGQGSFGEQQILSNNILGGSKVYAEDLDGDGDMDVLSANYDPPQGTLGTLAWYENMDGQGGFSDQQIIHQESRFGTLYAGDIDNDNDIDVIGGSGSVGIVWFENLQELSTEENDVMKIVLHPNPTQDFLQIENGQNIISLSIYDVSGRLLLQENQNFNNIDVSYLDRGLLFVNINSMDGIFTYKIVKK